jgi:hypothetical protein
MRIPVGARVLMVATAVIPVALIAIAVLRFDALPLLFAVAVGAPIFLLARHRGRRSYDRDEQRWAEREARRGRESGGR